jgi:1-acyl-sn-glycerol-3-phosphate acyltransferase
MRLVKEGVSVLFFPEGTRTSDGAMAAFKVSNFKCVPLFLGKLFSMFTKF